MVGYEDIKIIKTLFLGLKPYLEVLTLIGAVISFWYGRHLLRYKLDEATRKLYFHNCFKVQTVLDKFTKTGNVTLEDINTIALANQEAELYLNDEIVDLTKKIWDTMTHYYSCISENKKTDNKNHEEKLEKYIDCLSSYKSDLTRYYRKHLVYEKPQWLKWIANKLRSK